MILIESQNQLANGRQQIQTLQPRDLEWLHIKRQFKREYKHVYYLCFGLVHTLTPKFEKAASIGTCQTQYFSLLTEFEEFCHQNRFQNQFWYPCQILELRGTLSQQRTQKIRQIVYMIKITNSNILPAKAIPDLCIESQGF